MLRGWLTHAHQPKQALILAHAAGKYATVQLLVPQAAQGASLAFSFIIVQPSQCGKVTLAVGLIKSLAVSKSLKRSSKCIVEYNSAVAQKRDTGTLYWQILLPYCYFKNGYWLL